MFRVVLFWYVLIAFRVNLVLLDSPAPPGLPPSDFKVADCKNFGRLDGIGYENKRYHFASFILLLLFLFLRPFSLTSSNHWGSNQILTWWPRSWGTSQTSCCCLFLNLLEFAMISSLSTSWPAWSLSLSKGRFARETWHKSSWAKCSADRASLLHALYLSSKATKVYCDLQSWISPREPTVLERGC